MRPPAGAPWCASSVLSTDDRAADEPSIGEGMAEALESFQNAIFAFSTPVKKVIFLPFLSGGSTVLLIEGLPKSHTFAGVWRKAVLFGMSTVLTSVLFTRGPKHDFLNWSVMRRRLGWVGQAYTGGTLRACRWLACFFE